MTTWSLAMHLVQLPAQQTGNRSYEVTGCAYNLCSTDPGTGECTCTPSADGSCQVEGAAMVEGTVRDVTLTFEYPGYPPSTTVLDLVF